MNEFLLPLLIMNIMHSIAIIRLNIIVKKQKT